MKKNYAGIIILGLLLFLGGEIALAAQGDIYEKTDPWVYTITRKTIIENPSKNDLTNIRVTVPLMDLNQPLYQDLLGEEITPWPLKIITNTRNSRQGVFEIPLISAGQKTTITQRYAIRNYAINFNIEPGKISNNYDSGKIDPRYLQAEKKIESDHTLVINYAQGVVKNETNPYIMAQKLFADINLFMTYKDGSESNQGALNAVRTGVGNCDDYTDVYVAAARALGIPARRKTGYLYLPKEHNAPPYIQGDGSLDLSLMRHAWPEVYLPEVGWMVLDPTFTYTILSGKKQEKAVDWSKFGRITASSRHIFFSYGNHDDEYIELNYNGPKPLVQYSESLVFGNNVFPFRDASDHWAKDSIMFLSTAIPPIIGGYGNGLFGPNDQVTRAQLAAMLNRALSLNYNVGKPQFTDISPGYWGYADIAAAKGAGIVVGFPDGSFRPEKYVTRAELAVILDRAFDLPYPATGVSFRDLGKSGYAWADTSIINLAGNGIAAGYPKGLFLPEKTVTRAEVAVFLSRIIDSVFRLN